MPATLDVDTALEEVRDYLGAIAETHGEAPPEFDEDAMREILAGMLEGQEEEPVEYALQSGERYSDHWPGPGWTYAGSGRRGGKKWRKMKPREDTARGPMGGEALAAAIADWWNEHGEPDEGEKDAAAAELDGTGWGVWLDTETSTWAAVNMEEDGDDLPEDAVVVYAAERSPVGGVTIGGTFYPGGRWIPSQAVAGADAATKARITKNANTHKERVKSRYATREHVKAKTAKHADKHLSSREMTQARQMLAGLLSHHGEHVLSRIDELADQTQHMLDGYTEDSPNEVMENQLQKRMAMFHAMQQWLHERGHGQDYEEEARKHQEGKASLEAASGGQRMALEGGGIYRQSGDKWILESDPEKVASSATMERWKGQGRAKPVEGGKTEEAPAAAPDAAPEPAKPAVEKKVFKAKRAKSRTGDSLYKIIQDRGGINLADLKAGGYDVKVDFIEAGLRGLLRDPSKAANAAGQHNVAALDQWAETLIAEGHISAPPPNLHATDHLLNELKSHAKSLHANLDDEIEKQALAFYREQERAEREHGKELAGEAVRRGEEAGISEEAEGDPLEDAGSMADEEGGSGEDPGDFDFGLNADDGGDDTSSASAPAAPTTPDATSPPAAEQAEQGAKEDAKAGKQREPHEMTLSELRKRVQSQYMGPDSVADGTRTAGFTDKQAEADKAKELGLYVRKAGKFWLYEQNEGDGEELASALREHGYGSNSKEADRVSELAGYSEKQRKEMQALLDHKGHVQAALARGDTVPPEVLADYPDLKPKDEAKEAGRAREPHSAPQKQAISAVKGLLENPNIKSLMSSGSPERIKQAAGMVASDYLRKMNVDEASAVSDWLSENHPKLAASIQKDYPQHWQGTSAPPASAGTPKGEEEASEKSPESAPKSSQEGLTSHPDKTTISSSGNNVSGGRPMTAHDLKPGNFDPRKFDLHKPEGKAELLAAALANRPTPGLAPHKKPGLLYDPDKRYSISVSSTFGVGFQPADGSTLTKEEKDHIEATCEAINSMVQFSGVPMGSSGASDRERESGSSPGGAKNIPPHLIPGEKTAESSAPPASSGETPTGGKAMDSTTTAVAEKQPWELTKAEYDTAYDTAKTPEARAELVRRGFLGGHLRQVMIALMQGKSVPQEVIEQHADAIEHQEVSRLKSEFGDDYEAKIKAAAKRVATADIVGANADGSTTVRRRQTGAGSFHEHAKGDILLVNGEPKIVSKAKKGYRGRHDGETTGYFQDITLRDPKPSELAEVSAARAAEKADYQFRHQSNNRDYPDLKKQQMAEHRALVTAALGGSNK